MKKITLSAAVKKNDVELHNSNITNLAAAINAIDSRIAELTDLRKEIETFAANERNLQNTEETQRLYKLACYGVDKRTRW